MNWRAVVSKAFFRHPDIRVYTVQAFISGLCGVVLFLAVVSLNMSYWPTIMVGYFPIVLWSVVRSLKEEENDTTARNGFLNMWKAVLEAFMVSGAFMLGELALLAIGLMLKTGVESVHIHNILNDAGGAHVLIIAPGIAAGVFVLVGETCGILVGPIYRKSS